MRRSSTVRPTTPARILLALLAALPLGACAKSITGVQVHNTTDRIVRAELLQLQKNGEMTVYSSQVLSPGADFQNKVESEERRRGMRVRFMLADQGAENANWVMLSLPEGRSREYNLVLVGDRLSARDLGKTKKRPVNTD